MFKIGDKLAIAHDTSNNNFVINNSYELYYGII